MTYQEIATALSKLYANPEPMTVWAPQVIFTVRHPQQLSEIPFRNVHSAFCPVRIDVPVYGSEGTVDPDYPGQMKSLETLLGHQLEIEGEDIGVHVRGFWKDAGLCFCAEILDCSHSPYRISVDWLQNYEEPFKAFDVQEKSWENALDLLKFQVKERHSLTSKIKEFLESGKANG